MKDRVTAALKESMKARDAMRTSVLRMLLAEIQTLETSGQKSVDPAQAVAAYAKRLDKSIDEYTSLGQTEQVEKLKAEHAVAAEFLPQQLSAEQTEAVVDQVLADNPDLTARDMGKAMKIVMADHKGQVDGKLVQELVKGKLAQR
jgi:uncharacterized protein